MAFRIACPFGGDDGAYSTFLDELYEVCYFLTSGMLEIESERLLALTKLHTWLKECELCWGPERHVRGFLEPRRALLALRRQHCSSLSGVPLLKQAVCLDALSLLKTVSAPFSTIHFLGSHERSFQELLYLVELELSLLKRPLASEQQKQPLASEQRGQPLGPVGERTEQSLIGLNVRVRPSSTLRLRRWCWSLMEMILCKRNELVWNAAKRKAEEDRSAEMPMQDPRVAKRSRN